MKGIKLTRGYISYVDDGIVLVKILRVSHGSNLK